MRYKIIQVVAVIILISLAGSAGYNFGFRAGEQAPKNIVIQGVANMDGQAGVDFSTFWQTWKLIDENYLRADEVSPQNKVYGAISGLVGALKDPYSEYLPPGDNKKFQEDVQGNFGGIGAELGIRDNQLIIVAPLKNTPAERIGLLAGDSIFKINASSTEGITVQAAVQKIRGPIGTEVKLQIFREKWKEPKDFNITRENITIPTLDLTMKDGQIAHIQLYSFNANAERLLYDAAVKALSQDAQGIILDLRNDPGGFLEVAVDIAGWFLPRDTLVVSEEDKTGGGKKMYTQGNGAFKDMPLIVLINKGSASAAEILAGALRDQRGIKIIGEKSFGKGTVQQLLNLKDNSSLKITMAHWVMPSGKILTDAGITPDIEVKLTEEDIAKKRDPQLDKALEVLKSEISK
ncbi:MAG: S41 family peptidase [Patescibacteria group bacterium]